MMPSTNKQTNKQSRVALAALQVRLNVLSRKEPLFGYVEFNMLDSSREACAVSSLDMMCDPSKWELALSTALQELRAISHYGITKVRKIRKKQFFGSARLLARLLACSACSLARLLPPSLLTDSLAHSLPRSSSSQHDDLIL